MKPCTAEPHWREASGSAPKLAHNPWTQPPPPIGGAQLYICDLNDRERQTQKCRGPLTTPVISGNRTAQPRNAQSQDALVPDRPWHPSTHVPALPLSALTAFGAHTECRVQGNRRACENAPTSRTQRHTARRNIEREQHTQQQKAEDRGGYNRSGTGKQGAVDGTAAAG
jgi:hypothetical protein